MRIVYLDQNKWIDLLSATLHPTERPDVYEVLEFLVEEVRAGRILLPLTFTNIYETHKINNLDRRHNLAYVQATLSHGLVFRGPHRRLQTEIGDVVRNICGMPVVEHEQQWFLSNAFFESVLEAGDSRVEPISDRLLAYMRQNPKFFLYRFLLESSEERRVFAVKKYSAGADELRQRVERRRALHAGESTSMRRRIYSALLMIDAQDFILECARHAGAPWRTITDAGAANARRLISDVPTYYIELEITLRLEAQNRAITENDFRDMQSFSTVCAYADCVIAEKQFVNLAIQAGLDKKFNTRISSDLSALLEVKEAYAGPLEAGTA